MIPFLFKFDAYVKSRKPPFSVIPAKAGIQEKQGLLDPGETCPPAGGEQGCRSAFVCCIPVCTGMTRRAIHLRLLCRFVYEMVPSLSPWSRSMNAVEETTYLFDQGYT